MSEKNTKHTFLKLGCKFIVINENNREKEANKDTGVEVIVKKMGLIYFKLGGMVCRAPLSAFGEK